MTDSTPRTGGAPQTRSTDWLQDHARIHVMLHRHGQFVRNWSRIPAKKQITSDTQFERDFDITGDDGGELLEAAE